MALKHSLLDEPPSDQELREFLNNEEPKHNETKYRYKEHRGERRLISRQYGKDLASVIKMRYVQGHSYEEIMKLTGLSRHMVMGMIKPFRVMMDDPARIRAFKNNEATLIDGVKMLLLQGLAEQLSDPERRKKLDISRLTYGFGVLFDKNRLLEGQSTQNVMSLSDMVRAAHTVESTPVTEEAEVVAEDESSDEGEQTSD